MSTETAFDHYLTGVASQWTILAGAGVSVDSGLPIGKEFSCRLIDCIAADQAQGLRALLSPGSGHPWLRFELLNEALQLSTVDLKLSVLKTLRGTSNGVPDSNGKILANANHQHLASLALAGALVLTPNFDGLMEEKFLERGGAKSQIYYSPKRTNASSGGIIVLHGSVKPVHELDGSAEPAATLPTIYRTISWRHPFLEAINTRHLLVVGYSASDDFDLVRWLFERESDKMLHWVQHKDVGSLRRVALDDMPKPVQNLALRGVFYWRGPTLDAISALVRKCALTSPAVPPQAGSSLFDTAFQRWCANTANTTETWQRQLFAATAYQLVDAFEDGIASIPSEVEHPKLLATRGAMLAELAKRHIEATNYVDRAEAAGEDRAVIRRLRATLAFHSQAYDQVEIELSGDDTLAARLLATRARMRNTQQYSDTQRCDMLPEYLGIANEARDAGDLRIEVTALREHVQFSVRLAPCAKDLFQAVADAVPTLQQSLKNWELLGSYKNAVGVATVLANMLIRDADCQRWTTGVPLDLNDALAVANEATRYAQTVKDDWAKVQAALMTSVIMARQGNLPKSQQYLEDASSLAHGIDDKESIKESISRIDYQFALLDLRKGDVDTARRRLERLVSNKIKVVGALAHATLQKMNGDVFDASFGPYYTRRFQEWSATEPVDSVPVEELPLKDE